MFALICMCGGAGRRDAVRPEHLDSTVVEPRVPAVHVHHQRARHVLHRRGRRGHFYQTADHSSYLLGSSLAS